MQVTAILSSCKARQLMQEQHPFASVLRLAFSSRKNRSSRLAAILVFAATQCWNSTICTHRRCGSDTDRRCIVRTRDLSGPCWHAILCAISPMHIYHVINPCGYVTPRAVSKPSCPVESRCGSIGVHDKPKCVVDHDCCRIWRLHHQLAGCGKMRH